MDKISEPPSLSNEETINQVKQAILIVYGMIDPDPDSLSGNKLMSHFAFNDYQWIELAIKLTKIIKENNPMQTVTPPELENLVTVQDCIDLVLKKSAT